ncbi:MAG: branched-chain amino acid ABC transporter permease [Thermodesulfobacteriota bacterium]
MQFKDVVEIAIGGLTNSMILFIVAAGLTLVFGVLRIINFSHGAVYMLAAYLGYGTTVILGQNGYSFWLALLIAPLAVAALGAIIEVFLLRPMYKREHLMQLLLTYSLVLIIVDLTKIIWGAEPRMVPLPATLSGAAKFLGAIVPVYNLFLVIVGLAVMVLLWFFLNRTKLGHIIRAGVLDAEMTEAIGINLKLIYTFIFALGAWMAGLAGVLIAPLTSVAPGMDATMLMESFAVVVIGGMGSIGGAFFASILLGLANSFGLLWIPGLAIAFTFLVMAIVLVIRPWGLFGRPIK